MIGCDIDGVIAENPWISRNFLAIFLKYFCRRPNKDVLLFLREQKEMGNKIVIISGIWNVFKPIIFVWLKLYKVPFDFLCLRKIGDGKSDHKIRAIEHFRCEIFLEDDEEIIEAIQEKFTVQGKIKKETKNGSKFFVLIF